MLPAAQVDRPESPLSALDGAAPTPLRAALAQALTTAVARRALGPRVAIAVLDATTGSLLYGQGADAPVVPASTAKLATAAAALAALGVDTRLRTRTVLDRKTGTVVLVGGGDPTLAGPDAAPATYPRPARLASLARRTAAVLRARHQRTVALAIDDGLFQGPRTAVGWKPTYFTEGDVAPVSALEIDGGRIHPGDTRQPRRPCC